MTAGLGAATRGWSADSRPVRKEERGQQRSQIRLRSSEQLEEVDRMGG